MVTSQQPEKPLALPESARAVLTHLQKHIGIPVGIFPPDADEEDYAQVTLARFLHQPVEDVVAMATLTHDGVPRRLENGEKIHQEMLLCHHRFDDENAAAHLLLRMRQWQEEEVPEALRYGELIGPIEDLLPGTDKVGLYVAAPQYFPAEIAFCHDTTPPTMLLFMLPVTLAECVFIEKEGSEAFEAHLADTQEDLLDLERASVV